MIHYVNHLRLGDCYWHCLYLRRIALARPELSIYFHCKPEHHAQLLEVVADIPSIHIANNPPSDAINCWIGEKWYSHSKNMDMVAFLIDWFVYLSAKSDLPVVFTDREDLLADYPALRPTAHSYHTLVVNSYPQSGQFGFDVNEMNQFVYSLSSLGPVVTTSPVPGIPCTKPYTLTAIGSLSCTCELIVAVSTGPSWAIFNRYNHRRRANIHVMLRDQRLNYGHSLPHYDTLAACRSAFFP